MVEKSEKAGAVKIPRQTPKAHNPPPPRRPQTPTPPQNVPFRETHHISGAAVKMAEDRGCALSDLTPDDLRTIHPLFEDDVALVRSVGLGGGVV